MSSQARHIRGHNNSGRSQIKFRRDDLLWVGEGGIVNPHDGEVIDLPIQTEEGRVVAPTLLSMMERKVAKWRTLPAAIRPDGGRLDSHVAYWRVRNPDDLWPAPGQSQRPNRVAREPLVEDCREEHVPDHPFLEKYISGGSPKDGAPDGFVRVRKLSTVNLAEVVLRQAVAMHGGPTAAYNYIGRLAEQMWADDLCRAQELWDAIQASGGLLIEDEYVESLRPESSMSQAVEREIGHQILAWLGVDPNADISRPRGRPPAAAGDEGEIVRLEISPDGIVTGVLKASARGIPAGTVLADIDLLTLVELLGFCRTGDKGADADLFEAYLDAAAPDWREQAAAQAAGGDSAPAAANDDSPYDVLGVTPSTPMPEVAEAFRAMMQAVQNLPNPAPQRRLIDAFKTLKAMHKDAA